MAKSKFLDSLGTANLFATWGERIWRWLKALGLDSWITRIVFTISVTAYSYFASSKWFGNFSWWIAVPAGLIVVTSLTLLIKTLTEMRGRRPIDIQEVGKRCVEFEANVLEFVANSADNPPPRMLGHPGSREALTEAAFHDWGANVDHSKRTAARRAQKFASEAVFICQSLEECGIKPPDLSQFDFYISNIAVYIGAVGKLLKEGWLNEARKSSPERLFFR